ncbi:MAG TPA: hypothetical protein VG205_06460 [Acidimicrobiales bacterium]|nr:hypothetical protein [Acidimicrobiales bacterium]
MTDMINEQPHLDNEQKRILEHIFSHPTSGNIKWPQVLALLEALGEVTVESKDRYRVTVSGHTEVFRPPHPHNDLPVEAVVKLRKFLAAADQQIESDGS